MGDPDYVYRPMSAEARAKASAAHRKRLGCEPGHRLLYGVQVPEDLWPQVHRAAHTFRKKEENADPEGLESTTQFVRVFVAILRAMG